MTQDTTVELKFDPYAYAIHEDPYPTYARLRAEAPLYRNDERRFWALSRYEDVAAAFRDAAKFSSAHGVSLDPAATGPHADRTASFLAMDDPRHGRMRALVSTGFTPRRVLDLEPRIRDLTIQYLAPALDRGQFDFIADLAGKLPMDVISELLGVPVADRDELRRLADLVLHREEGVHDIPPAAAEAAIALYSYYHDMIDERRRRPSEDLTSSLLEAEIDGDRLTDTEIIGFLFLMVVAGNETTTKLLGNAWYWGWRFPDQGTLPFADPDLIQPWIEETLRYDTSTQVIARTAAQDVCYPDGTVRAGDRVLLLIGSANRDERVFADGDRYDIARDTSATLSFGVGRHFCLGAALARLETRVGLSELVRTVASYDIDPAGIRRVHSVNVRGMASLPTTVRAR